MNQGVRIDPMYVTHIEDRQGNVLATFTPKANDVLPERVAHTIIEMMKRVITGGTGRRMMTIYGIGGKGMDIAAKTGTTNKNVDAWFMCAVPNLVVATWVGTAHINQASTFLLVVPVFAAMSIPLPPMP